MTDIFISYRRSASKHLARLIFSELRARGYDVFLDVTTIDSGEFDRIILNQIAARPHFLLVLSQGALERCANEGDWLRREIEEAFRLKRNIVPVYDEGFNIDQEKRYLLEPIRSKLPRLNASPYSHYYFDAFMDTLCTRFLKPPEYDVIIVPTPQPELDEVTRRIEVAASTAPPAVTPELPVRYRPTSLDLMPEPFAWIDILAGTVTLEGGGYIQAGGEGFYVPAFTIAKYPTTNAQFAKFIEAEGYEQRRYWTNMSWRVKQERGWRTPVFWEDNEWNKPEHPVVGVSWCEAVAFCLWLRDVTGEDIMLPTEQQWQRAAQDNSNRAYPWGREFDETRCNFGGTRTTPVTRYEGKGDSPSGVVDMAGNVWEWCLTGYKTGHTGLDGTEVRVLRGGSFYDYPNLAACTHRSNNNPFNGDNNVGFRVMAGLALHSSGL
jgi:hypothetical protein